MNSKKRRILTYEICKEAASKYDSFSVLKKKEGGVLNKIKREGWNELICHIKTDYEKRISEFNQNKLFEPHEYYLNYDINDIEGEAWIDIKGYEGLYKISNMGRVKSLEKEIGFRKTKPETIKRGYIQHKGYVKVQLNKSGKHKNPFVHRLVIGHFTQESFLEVNHKNMVKTDNRLENLEYVTGKENVNHAKTMTNRIWHHTIGANNHGAKRILGINAENKNIVYDIPFVYGVYEYLPPDELNRDLRGIIRRCLKYKLIYLECCWMYYDDYVKEGLNPVLFSEPKRSNVIFNKNKQKAFVLFKQGMGPSEVSKITKISIKSVSRYWKKFKMENGI